MRRLFEKFFRLDFFLIVMVCIFAVGHFKQIKTRCYDLSRDSSQVSLCKELFGEK